MRGGDLDLDTGVMRAQLDPATLLRSPAVRHPGPMTLGSRSRNARRVRWEW